MVRHRLLLVTASNLKYHCGGLQLAQLAKSTGVSVEQICQPEFGVLVLSLFHNKSIVDTQERPFSRTVRSVMEDFLSERRLGRIHGRRKRMDVDGQAAVGDQLTTDGGSAFGLVSDKGEWWLGNTAAKCATRQRRLITDGRGSSSAMQPSPQM